MDYSIETLALDKQQTDCMIVGLYENQQLSPSATVIDTLNHGVIKQLIERGDINGKNAETLLINHLPNSSIKRILLVGLGEKEKLSAKLYRKALSSAITALKALKIKSACCTLADIEINDCDSRSDMFGSVHNAKGLDVPAVMEWLREHKRLEGYAEAEHLPNSKQLELDCDILVPAATENQITSKNVDRIKARLIVEGANGPTTAVADKVLDERGVTVVPDILANAGGVTVSYFEWVQDRMGYFWTEEIVNARLEQTMVQAFGEVYSTSRKYEVSLRTAAYILALERVVSVYRLRGIFA